MIRSKAAALCSLTIAVSFMFAPSMVSAQEPRVIEIVASKDSRFKIPGQKGAPVTVKPGEVVCLRITAEKGSEWMKDGTVHTFTIRELKTDGWDLKLKQGTHDYTVKAPDKPGEYLIECTVRCGPRHELMRARLYVQP